MDKLLFEYSIAFVAAACTACGICGMFLTNKRTFILRSVLLVLPVIASALIWRGYFFTLPVIQLMPSFFVMLLLPGFIIANIFFRHTCWRLDKFDKLPLFFALALGLWTSLSILAYRFQLPTDIIIKNMLVFDLIGILLCTCLSPKETGDVCSFKENTSENSRYLTVNKIIFIGIVIFFALIVTYRSQYQGSFFDTYYHLAAFKKYSLGNIVMGGDVFLGSNVPCFIGYATNPWHLVVGLTSRMSNVNVAWMYVFLSGIMTVYVSLVVYSLFKTIISDKSLTILGSIFIFSFLVFNLA